jgi:hypothetical protein
VPEVEEAAQPLDAIQRKATASVGDIRRSAIRRKVSDATRSSTDRIPR